MTIINIYENGSDIKQGEQQNTSTDNLTTIAFSAIPKEAKIISVQTEIKPIIKANWSWNCETKEVDFLNGENVQPGQTVFVLYSDPQIQKC